MPLYLFNPEHDYALANNDPHFMAPASAVKFADDCAPFLRYLAPEPGYILCPYRETNPFYDMRPQTFTDQLPPIDKVVPWGWDRLMQRQLHALLPELSVDDERIAEVRALAHRQIAIRGMEFLRAHCPHLQIPPAATLLRTPDEIANYIAKHREVILKSPYSGNGRGNLYTHRGNFSATLQRQTTGVLRRQGAILGEPLYAVVQDFAMEFHCQNQQAAFAGYSLFNTRHYGYAGNLLCSDDQIEQTLSQWISTEDLHTLCEALLRFVQTEIAPRYDGYIGVDMFVYQEDNRFKVNPMVEINVRMTMGMAAHILYERYVHPESRGTMRLEYRPQSGDMLDFINQQVPMRLQDDRWHTGTLALNPIDNETQYAVVVEVAPF